MVPLHLVDFQTMVINKPFHALPGELRCPRCFGKDIVPSMPRGWLDSLMRAFDRIPRHCRFCECRFYIRLTNRGTEGAAPQD
jgi:hypothetical protein